MQISDDMGRFRLSIALRNYYFKLQDLLYSKLYKQIKGISWITMREIFVLKTGTKLISNLETNRIQRRLVTDFITLLPAKKTMKIRCGNYYLLDHL